MHRTEGDGLVQGTGKYTNPINIYADEAPPIRDATQVRHEEFNAIQEEICNVIEGEGLTLNASTESPAQMSQLEEAINNKLKSDRITNESSVPGLNVTEAINQLNSSLSLETVARVTGDTNLNTRVDNADLNIGSLQTAVGTVVGVDLQTQVATEKTRNDAQDVQITALDAKVDKLDDASALNGDSFIFKTSDSKWFAGSQIPSVKPRVVVDAQNGKRYSNSSDTPSFAEPVGIDEITLFGRYADPNDAGVPQGDTSFAEYTILPANIEYASIQAVYRGFAFPAIWGHIVVKLPATITGYAGYVTNIFTGLSILTDKQLWIGRLSDTQFDGVGRGLAPYKKLGLTDNVNYEAEETGNLICYPFGSIANSGIYFGALDTWMIPQTRSNARTMPSLFTPSKKYAISFSIESRSFTNVNPY